MPNINEINSAGYRLLKSDETLDGLCTLYKGVKRPSKAQNPSVTVDAKRLEHGKGDVLANRMPDHEKMEELSLRILGVMSDSEIELEGAKAFPLIPGESKSPEWDSSHYAETLQEFTFGLVFVQFS